MTEDPRRVPRIAVVVPTHDEPLVEAALASLADEERVELVVVDDGSHDPLALEALDRLASEGVRVLRQENAGVAAARMAGVRATRAPYVFALDADDWLEPGALTALADALDAQPQAAVAWGDLIVENGESLYRPSAPALDPWLMAFVNAIPACSLVRRQHLLEVGGWQEEVGPADKDLWLRFAERGFSGVYLSRAVYHYRADGGGMFARGAARYDERFGAVAASHRWLFDDLRAWRCRSAAPRRLKLALTALDRLPLSKYRRGRLARGLMHLLWLGSWRCAWHYLRRQRLPGLPAA